MSASAIADSLVNLLSATSAFGTNGAGTDYSVMEKTSACCCVISWAGLVDSPDTYGDPPDFERLWTFSVETFIKDRGDPSFALKGTLGCVDKVITVIEDNDTLEGTVENVLEIRGERTPGEALVLGGEAWLPMRIQIDVREWKNG